ncbi:MAG: glycosyltransferase, partial [Candidatus Binatia bacterium]
MLTIFYILAALLIVLSFKSLRGGINFLRYAKDELAKPPSSFAPFVSVIAPCKGLDDGIEKNLATLLDQDYPDYEVIFVVDDDLDQAIPAIATVTQNIASAAVTAKMVVAPKTTISSQKVENLREAVLRVADESRVFVFVDSDARPAKDWLRNLVAPLENQNAGAATGYRWYISENPSFASEL